MQPKVQRCLGTLENEGPVGGSQQRLDDDWGICRLGARTDLNRLYLELHPFNNLRECHESVVM